MCWGLNLWVVSLSLSQVSYFSPAPGALALVPALPERSLERKRCALQGGTCDQSQPNPTGGTCLLPAQACHPGCAKSPSLVTPPQPAPEGLAHPSKGAGAASGSGHLAHLSWDFKWHHLLFTAASVDELRYPWSHSACGSLSNIRSRRQQCPAGPPPTSTLSPS